MEKAPEKKKGNEMKEDRLEYALRTVSARRNYAETQNRERDEEIGIINQKVKELHLHVKPVNADGNCLYVAL